MVTKARIVFGSLFSTYRGVTQVKPVSLTIFNIVVDVVVRAVHWSYVDPQEAHHGFGWSAGEYNICLYADDGRISGRNPIWVLTNLKVLVRMFYRVGLQTNLGKTK